MLYIRLIMLLVAVALICTGVLLLENSPHAMSSFLVAYTTSAIVVLASFRNYQTMVLQRVENEKAVNEQSDYDLIDKIDDPYNLYEKQEPSLEQSNIKEIIKEEKRRLKEQRGSIWTLFKNSLQAFRFWRLFAYFILILGFFYLLKNKMLILSYYLGALIIPIVIVILYLLLIKDSVVMEHKE